MELKRALSNPRLQVELKGLSELRTALGNRMPANTSLEVKPRRTPIVSTVLQVLQLGDGQPMKLAEIQFACVSLLGADVSYRSLKNGLSDHQRGKHPVIVRVGRGLYRMRDSDVGVSPTVSATARHSVVRARLQAERWVVVDQ